MSSRAGQPADTRGKTSGCFPHRRWRWRWRCPLWQSKEEIRRVKEISHGRRNSPRLDGWFRGGPGLKCVQSVCHTPDQEPAPAKAHSKLFFRSVAIRMGGGGGRTQCAVCVAWPCAWSVDGPHWLIQLRCRFACISEKCSLFVVITMKLILANGVNQTIFYKTVDKRRHKLKPFETQCKQ